MTLIKKIARPTARDFLNNVFRQIAHLNFATCVIIYEHILFRKAQFKFDPPEMALS